MENKLRKLICAFSVMMFSLAISSCQGGNSEQPKYDGRVFDISASQDESITASLKKVGNNYEIVISGKGEAISYEKKEHVPWNAISKKISSVTINEGITNIGNYYFYSSTLTDYYIPSSVTTIEENSFNPSAVIYSYSTEPITVNCENDIYYYSESSPTVNGQYWHKIGDSAVIWDVYKVLFIGNSFTFYPNDLFSTENPAVCALTKELADSLGMSIIVESVVKGAHTLKKFSNEKDELGSIVHEKLTKSSDYDYVILQEQSTTPVNDYNSFNLGVSSLVSKINQTQKDCEVVLYSTWGFPSGVSSSSIFSSVSTMEELIREAYDKCANENDLKVSYVGEAFTYVYENYPNISLYGSDDKHQSYAGAYLSAGVHLSTLFGVDVRESSFIGILDQSTADILQEVAYDVVFN